MKYHGKAMLTGSSGKGLSDALKDMVKSRLGAGQCRWEKFAAEALKGGLSDDEPDEKFDKKKLKKGVKTEKEHTNSKGAAKEIAKDHLKEDKKYYDKLEKMEKKAQQARQGLKELLKG